MANAPSLLNKKAVRQFALDYCKASRPRFERVSEDFFRKIEATLKNQIKAAIHAHPGIGKTLKGD